MRTLAILGWFGAFVGTISAQDQKKTDFATGKPTTITVTQTPALPLPAPVPVTREYCPEQLLRMDEWQLIEIYKCGSVAPVPGGYTPGVVILKPGTKLAVPRPKRMKL